MGTITGISDLDPVPWPNSHWRSVKVGWDESTTGKRQPRVSLWEIEPLTTFPSYPSLFPLGLKRPWPSELPALHGLKDGNLSINSPLIWLQGGVDEQVIQSLNFLCFGVSPWMQPQFDASMSGLQLDVYQAMAAAALQKMQTVESSKIASQSQNPYNGPAALIQRQMLQQFNLQNSILPNFLITQSSALLLEQQLQRQQQLNDQQQKLLQLQQQVQQSQQLHQLSSQQQIPTVNIDLPHLAPVTQSRTQSLDPISSQCQQQPFPEAVGNSIATSDFSAMHKLIGSLSQDGASHLLNSNGSKPVISSALLPKQGTVDPQITSGAVHSFLQPVEQLGAARSNVPEFATLLPPFPGREYSADQGAADPQNNLLFGVHIDSSSFMLHHGVPNLRNIGSENDSLTVPYTASTLTSAMGSEIPHNSDMTTSSYVEESGFFQSSDNLDQVNPPIRTL